MQMRREALAEMPPLPFKGRRLCIHDSGCFSANPVHQGRKQRPAFLISLSLNLIRVTHASCSMPDCQYRKIARFGVRRRSVNAPSGSFADQAQRRLLH